MHDAIMVELATTGNAVTVFGWSQSAIIASLEMQRFTAMGGAAPSASDLNFVLVGNEMNPNGGMLARFPDLTLPTLDLTFYGATPSDTIYPTAIYTLEYDGFADFSRYPLNFISDLNAVAGITFVHTKYLDLTPAQVEGLLNYRRRRAIRRSPTTTSSAPRIGRCCNRCGRCRSSEIRWPT